VELIASLDLTCRALLGAVFLAAVVEKLRSRGAFAELVESLKGLGALPAPVWIGVGASLATLEAAAVALLAAAPTAGFALALALFASFVTVLARALRRGAHVRCRCFGAAGGILGREHLARDAALALVAAAGLAAQSAAPDASAPAAVLLAAGGTGALAGLLAARWDDLAYLLGRRPATEG
jgi:Methylamine utilisation protein MauE